MLLNADETTLPVSHSILRDQRSIYITLLKPCHLKQFTGYSPGSVLFFFMLLYFVLTVGGMIAGSAVLWLALLAAGTSQLARGTTIQRGIRRRQMFSLAEARQGRGEYLNCAAAKLLHQSGQPPTAAPSAMHQDKFDFLIHDVPLR